ncbi:MAG: YfhO family protein [bacterium]|nr:YfhO family protein [bacterium]
MKNFSNIFFPLAIFFVITAFFFWPTVLKGYIPFPGDLLVGHYEPYKSNSYFGWGPGGVPHKAQGPDVIREAYPWKFFATGEIKNGRLPYWNPYSFAGNPQLANFQTAAFYPLNLVFLVFPFDLGWTIFIFFQPILAGLFTYLFAKELGLRRIAAVFSGIVFAFSSFFTVWIEYGNIGHAFLWFPLALYLTEKLIKNFTWQKIIFLIIVLTLSILAGFIQITIYVFGTVVAYFLYRFFSTEKKKISHALGFILALIIPLLISAFQLLPTFELFQLSAREPYLREDLPRLLNPVYYAVTTFVPDFFGHPATRNFWFDGTYIEKVSYIGVIPLLLAFVGFFGKKKNHFWFFAILGGAIYLLSLNVFPTTFILGLKPPIISTAVPSRILSIFCFSGAILAGIGLNSWVEEKRIKIFKKGVIIFLLIYLFLWTFVFLAGRFFPQETWTTNLSVAKRNLFIPTALALSGGGLILAGEMLIKNKKIITLMIFVFTLADLFYFFHKITPFSPKEFIYPQTPVLSFLKEKAGIDRFWGYGAASIETNFAAREVIFSTDGSDALHIKRYGELITASKDGKIHTPVPRRDANIFPGYGQDDLRNNFFRQRALDLLGVKYLLNKNDGLGEEWKADTQTFPPEFYKLVWQEGKWQVYENEKVLPRIFLTTNYLVEKNAGQIIKKIFEKNFDLKTLILEENLPDNTKLSGGGQVRLESYTPRQIKMAVVADGSQLLFISDSHYPGWKAFIDGTETKIYRAHYSFRAAVVPPGSHEVIFDYQPTFL